MAAAQGESAGIWSPAANALKKASAAARLASVSDSPLMKAFLKCVYMKEISIIIIIIKICVIMYYYDFIMIIIIIIIIIIMIIIMIIIIII